MTVATAGAWPHRHGQKARVRFLATSTLIRGTWGQNEDTYLAQLLLPKQNEAVLVRLVDAYANEWPPLARAALTADAGTVLSVKRDAECDRPFGEMLLRTAPGDPMAILPERLGYRPPLDRTSAAGTVLPCYRVLRR
jgi:hypothetical protein